MHTFSTRKKYGFGSLVKEQNISYFCISLNNRNNIMEQFNTLLTKRRSYRKYTDEPIGEDQVQLILEAALLAPTSKNSRSWEFVAVEDKEMLAKLANCKPQNGKFIADAPLAIVVLGNPLETDVWIEDASIAATLMQLQAEALDLGSCWVQVRGRNYTDTVTSAEYINELLDIPMPLETVCIITFGHKLKQRDPRNLDSLTWEKVHIGKF